ncbi:NHLP family bacteriocin export ABC transporter permease/ATPase subunit [Azorhizobium oxalatiphilum]|uniref:NHLP family bacteriocin export ABC transporter permease/ATPase subunit n=1 Tax=Azorhizobium oxalatiphilum TaxID=980631 RepID=A0A917BWN3_9HYPH|nr:NHLP bacteriocin export ABC transporter permease/ATPase subunit [Azorhizobium oxalatiphilum]GGF57632.1 NHLP family bacteriocin export ABC transporter permease/ATPase subunit [Azorhizobium oxalatiphilum]
MSAPVSASDAPLLVTGSHPLKLDDPALCYRVLSGDVQVFLVEVLDDGRAGTRQHLFEAGPGDLLFGLDTQTSFPPVMFLAAGTPDTQVVAVPRPDFSSSGDVEGVPALEAVDRWLVAMSRAIARQIVPRPRLDLPLASGESVTLAHEAKVTAAHGVAWCATSADGLFVDLEHAGADGLPVPLTPDSWLSLPADVTADASATADLAASGMLSAALDRFHAIAIDVLPMALRLTAVDELNRLRERGARNRRASDLAFGSLGAVLGSSAPRGTPPTSDQPLVLALAHLGLDIGFEVRLPTRRADHERPFDLDTLTRLSRVRTRRVRLEPGWWKTDSGPFLLLRAAPLTPLALIYRGRQGYAVFDPAERVERRLAPEEAAGLAGDAVALYAALPDRALTLKDIGLRVLKARARDIAAMGGGTLLAGVLAMGVPVAMSYLLESVIPDNNLLKVAQVALALVVLAAMTLLLRLSLQLTMLRIEGLEGSRLQAAVMDRMLRLPTSFFRGFTTGDLGTRVMAVARLEQALTASMVSSITTGAIALVSYAVMLAYSWRLGLVAIALTILLAGLTLALGLLSVRHERTAIGAEARMSGLTLELAAGITKLRLAAAEDRAFFRWARLYATTSRAQYEADRAQGLLTTLSTGFPLFALTVLFAVCVYGDLADGIGLGLLVAFVTAFSSALEGLRTLAATAVQMATLGPIVEHARPILETLPEADAEKSDPGELSGAIELSRVTFQYQPDAPRIFSDLTISIRPGEFVAFVGPSGTGKSTLFRLLLGFEKPASGVVLYDGVDLAGLDVQAVRRQCGVVLQNGKLMPGSLMENILGSAPQLGEAAAWEAAGQVALEEDIRRMPMGMHTVVTDGGSNLSGGQVQRLLLARALVGKPRIMMLDEATSALDNRTQAAVTSSLNRIAGTRLVIAHRLSTVERADRIIVLNNGQVAEEGSYDALMARNGFFTAFARRQLAE